MLLDVAFVLGAGWGIEGVAAGTVAAEWLAASVGLALAVRTLSAGKATHSLRRLVDRSRVFERSRMRRTLSVNRDIMVRSMALVLVFVFFSAQGAAQGDVFLAANAVLMHFIDTSAYFLDGLAYAAEAMVGHAFGARDGRTFRTVAVRTTVWAAAFAVVATGVLFFFGPSFVDAMTVDPPTRQTARVFLHWAAFAPVAGVVCFQLDGIFIGATQGPAMRNSMLLSTAIFFGAWWLLRPFGNHGLWAAFYVHYAARTLTLGAHVPGLLREADGRECAMQRG